MLISIKNLTKHIGKQEVLKDISLDVAEGQIVGLLGPNGAGKSTLMKIICGIWEPDRREGEQARRRQATGDGRQGEMVVPERIGYLPEQNPLYGEMFVREFLLTMKHLTGATDDIEALIDRVGLRPEANKKIGQLSKGYKQRVGLAHALMGQPQLLILDEPTTGLDPNQLIEIRQLIKSLTKEQQCTVILSTHILQEVREMCDRVVLLDHGIIKADKPISEIADLEQLFTDGTRI